MYVFTFVTLALCKTKAVMRELGKWLIAGDIFILPSFSFIKYTETLNCENIKCCHTLIN